MSEYLQRLLGSGSQGVVRRRQSIESMDEKKEHTVEKHNANGRTRGSIQPYIQKGPVAAILLTIVTIIAILGLRPYLSRGEQHEVVSTTQSKYLQLVIPVNRKYDADLCKTVLSAQVLNYPVPAIVPWGNTSDNALLPKEKRVYHKVARTYAYLSTLPAHADDAITILLDGPDTWFQLRPEMLLQGYYRATRRANSRLEEMYGPGVRQKVIFSAHKTCGLTDPEDPACSVVPDPPTAGAPKYMGHGAMVGPAKDILAIVRRALNKLETSQNPPSKLLPVFTQIFAEQEEQRKLRSARSQSRHKRQNSKEEVQASTHTDVDMTAELGIGLDYQNELGYSASADAGPRLQKPQVLLEELDEGLPPYWTVSGLEQNLPHDIRWSDLELLTVDDGSIPAMIHHYPTVAMGGKDATGQRRSWWPYLWLTSHARALYTAAERLPATIVAEAQDEQGRNTVFWNRQPSHNKAGVWLPDWRFLHFQEMCAPEAIWQEVFRDEEGPWARTEWF